MTPTVTATTSLGAPASVRWLRWLLALPAALLLALIRLYQATLSPVLPVIFGSACGCRFSPTCSHYAADAIRTHGAFVGALLAMLRLVKCTPLHPGGFDPVPAKDDWTTGPRDNRTKMKPTCHSLSRRKTIMPSTGGPVVP
jgi:putative membrane protein insertion efficiency factor